MSEYGISETGFQRKRLDILLTELNAEMKNVFGSNFDISPESAGGQVNGVLSESNSNLWQVAEEAYDAFNPSKAIGTSLSNLVQLNGITRKPALESITVLIITGTQSTIIPSGSLVSTSDTKVQFSTNDSVVIGVGGTVNVNATAVEVGPIEALATTINTIDSPVTGWDSVSNTADAILGQNEETDVELRARREKSVSRDAVAILESVLAEVLAVLEVTNASIVENDTDITSGLGVPPHAFETIVSGGADADIADAIFLKKPVGIQAHGDTIVVVTDSQGFSHSIGFSRPTEIDIYVEIDVTSLIGFPTNGAEDIKQAIVDYANGILVEGREFNVGDGVILSELYTPINSVEGVSVTSLSINKTGAPVTEKVDIPIAVNEISRFTIANITVNVT